MLVSFLFFSLFPFPLFSTDSFFSFHLFCGFIIGLPACTGSLSASNPSCSKVGASFSRFFLTGHHLSSRVLCSLVLLPPRPVRLVEANSMTCLLARCCFCLLPFKKRACRGKTVTLTAFFSLLYVNLLSASFYAAFHSTAKLRATPHELRLSFFL